MIATYDTEAGLVAIDLGDLSTVVDSIEPHPRAIVAIDESGNPVQIEIADIDSGLEEPITAVAEHAYTGSLSVDRNFLLAAARAAATLPDQVVTISVDLRAA